MESKHELNDELQCDICGHIITVGANEIRNLIKCTANLADDDIKVLFTTHDSYYYFYNDDETGIHDDVYVDGAIEELNCGKLFTDFHFVLIVKKDNGTNKLRKLVAIIKTDTKNKASSTEILKYFSPSVLELML